MGKEAGNLLMLSIYVNGNFAVYTMFSKVDPSDRNEPALIVLNDWYRLGNIE